jgi:glyoxylase-like metal-dependent hydrolase (beta-lactamase superfamily II)
VVDDLGQGLHRIRLPLPWSGLDHVNSYALEGAPGWTLVDAGLGTREALEAWKQALAALGDPPIAQLVVTHYHTDHIGASADLARLTGCAVAMTATDATQARVWHDPDSVAATRRHLERNGCPPEIMTAVMDAWDELVQHVHPAPVARILEEGDVLVAAGEPWRVVPTPGHADGQIALFGAVSHRLLTADAMIAAIEPFVGVHPISRPDPLGDHLATIDRLARLGASVGYPGHGDPVRDVAARAVEMRAHYLERLQAHRAALAAGAADAFAVSLRVFGDRLGPNARRLAVVECLANLVHLVRRGEARSATLAAGHVVFEAA